MRSTFSREKEPKARNSLVAIK